MFQIIIAPAIASSTSLVFSSLFVCLFSFSASVLTVPSTIFSSIVPCVISFTESISFFLAKKDCRPGLEFSSALPLPLPLLLALATVNPSYFLSS
eukprot:c35502_g1_i1 orf=1-282(-)